MGRLKKKYTKKYFLGSIDKKTNKVYGVAGFESFKNGHINERYERLLSNLHLKGKVVLDIGCGRGEVVNYCAKKGAKIIIGIDFSEYAIKIASKLNRDNSNVKLIKLEAKDIKFRDKFDIIFMLDVIEHIPDKEMQLIYSKIYSALKNKGILILNTPFFKSLEYKDHSDFIPAVCGMHCNKQTEEKLNADLINHKFKKYSIDVWGKSDKFSLRIFLYANAQNSRKFVLKWFSRIIHPKRTFSKLCMRLFDFKGFKK